MKVTAFLRWRLVEVVVYWAMTALKRLVQSRFPIPLHFRILTGVTPARELRGR